VQVGNAITLALVLGGACAALLETCTANVLDLVAGSDNGVTQETMDIAVSYLRCAAAA
jgi:hypothetical protein